MSGNFLTSALLGLALFAAGSARADNRPNILFIAVDDMVTRLGCYGDPLAISPRIDQLAAGGVLFRNHHTQWAVCGPSRACLTTSLMPEETGVTGFKPIRAVLPDVITLPQHFRNQGYETAGTGKFYDPRTVGTFTDPNGSTNQDNEDLPSWSVPYDDSPAGIYPAGNPAVDASDLPDSSYVDYNVAGAGLRLLDDLVSPGGAAAGDKPFFLAVGFKKPHLPFVAPKSRWDLYDRAAMPLAAFAGLPLNGAAYSAGTLGDNDELLGYEPYATTGLPDTTRQRELIHGYYACISFVDSQVGRLLDKLAATDDPRQPGKKLSETTIVVFWSDHGFYLGEHGHWGKHTNLEQGTGSPLIIRDPRRPATAGSIRLDPVQTVDLYPTLCELAGLPIPSQPVSATVLTGRPLRGRSLVPLLDGANAILNHGALSLFAFSGQYGYAYRTESFRYIEWISSTGVVNARELYDYRIDPLETRNFAAEPEYASVVYQLSRSMRADVAGRGSTRLLLAPAVTGGADQALPDTTISAVDPDALRLRWLPAAGLTQEVLFKSDLNATSWQTVASVAGDTLDVPMMTPRAFFVVKPGANHPPVFASDPLTSGTAFVGQPYTATLAGLATDADGGDVITFARVAGPTWLGVAADGTLSGTPVEADLGAVYFTVTATDNHGAATSARLQITVSNDVPPPVVASITEVSVVSSTAGTYGQAFFPSVTVAEGDMLIIAHANNKNSATNTITLTGLGANPVTSISSGSTGTGSSAWIFASNITTGGTYALALDTSNATKTVSPVTSCIVLRPVNGTLSLAATDGKAAATGMTSLSLNLVADPAVSDAYGVAAAAVSTATSLGTSPADWITKANSNNKRRTYSTNPLSGSSFTLTCTPDVASDIALAGAIVRVTPSAQ